MATKIPTGKVPVLIILDGRAWERVVVGLADKRQVKEWEDGERNRVTLVRSRTVLWYTKESGGLDGVAVGGPKGCRFSAIRDRRTVDGIKDLGTVTSEAWALIEAADAVR